MKVQLGEAEKARISFKSLGGDEFVPMDWEILRVSELPENAVYAEVSQLWVALRSTIFLRVPTLKKVRSAMGNTALEQFCIQLRPAPKPVYEPDKFVHTVGSCDITPEEFYGASTEEIIAALKRQKLRATGFGEIIPGRKVLDHELKLATATEYSAIEIDHEGIPHFVRIYLALYVEKVKDTK